MRICVDVAGIKDMKNDIQKISDDLRTYMEQVENVVLSIDGEWQGEAEKAYVARIVYVKSQFSTVIEFLEQYIKLLDDFSDQYEEHDKELAAKINLI